MGTFNANQNVLETDAVSTTNSWKTWRFNQICFVCCNILSAQRNSWLNISISVLIKLLLVEYSHRWRGRILFSTQTRLSGRHLWQWRTREGSSTKITRDSLADQIDILVELYNTICNMQHRNLAIFILFNCLKVKIYTW